MKASTPYCRVYWTILDDPKFDGIREDMRALGTWTLCLVVADMAYPAPAFVPPVPAQSFARLVDAGLIDRVDANRYRVHGLEAERARRSEAARVGGLASGRSRSAERPLSDGSPDPRTESNLAEYEPRPRRVRAKGERDVVVHDGGRDPEGTVVIGLVDPSPDHACPACTHRMVEARPGRWVCTNAPAHGAVPVVAGVTA